MTSSATGKAAVTRRWPRSWIAWLIFSQLALLNGILLVAGADKVAPWLRFPLLGMIAIPVLLLVPFGWRQIHGPVLLHDAVRSARRGRPLLLRSLYAVLLLGILCWFYLNWFAGLGGGASLAILWQEANVPVSDMPRFAGDFFTTFLIAQVGVVLVLTPLMTAGAIAEEKERRTLEFLLATDLSSSEIVLGKLASRLANLGLIVLTGLPVLALTQLWGGVEPVRILAGFLITAATLLSLGSLGMLNSVHARRTLDGVLRTYGELLLFFVLGPCIPVAILGHPWYALAMMFRPDGFGVIPMTFAYTSIHVLATIVFCTLAIQRLRAVALRSTEVPIPEHVSPAPARVSLPGAPERNRPALGTNALLWKEMHGEQEFRWDRLHPLMLVLFLFGGVCAATLGLSLFLIGAVEQVSMLPAMNLWVRSFSTPMAGLMFLIMAFCVAGSVSREREQSTLESLLTVPDGAVGILRAKWLGGFFSARRLWWCLGVIWGWGVVTCGLNVLAVPLLLAAWAVLAGFVVSLSLFCSVACRTTLRATLTSVVVLLLCGAGPSLVFKVGESLLANWLGLDTEEGLVVFLRNGLTLPVPLWTLAMSYNEVFDPATRSGSLGKVLAALAGLACYALAGWVLWKLTVWRFLAEMGPRPRRG